MPSDRPSMSRRPGAVQVLTLLMVSMPAVAQGQATLREDPLDPVYVDLELLRGFGLLGDQVFGQRPYSRRRIARLITTARRDGRNPSPVAGEVLERLERRYEEELLAFRGEGDLPRLSLLDVFSLDFVDTNAEGRSIPDNGLGGIDAVVNPVVQNRQGRRPVEGTNLGLEGRMAGHPARWLALSVTPRVQLSWGRDGVPTSQELVLQNLQANVLLGNVQIAAGRQYNVWGPSPDGGLLLSTNPRGLDLIQIGSDLPFRLPGILEALGPTSLSLFAARLEEDRHVPHSWLVGYRAGFRPGPGFELGLSALIHSGGVGAPTASFGRTLADHVIFLDPFLKTEVSNKLLSLDARLGLSRATGAEIYVDYTLDDPAVSLRKTLWKDAGWIVGLWLPRVTADGRWNGRAEFRHAGLRLYRHHQYRSGLTVEGLVTGAALGPDGHAGTLMIGFRPSPGHRLELEGDFERRSRDAYVGVPGPEIRDFERVASFPVEGRTRIVAAWTFESRGGRLGLSTRVGLEWVDNFHFEAGTSGEHFLLDLGLSIRQAGAHVRSLRLRSSP